MCSNSLFPTRKLLEDSFDDGEGKSYTYIVVYMSPGSRESDKSHNRILLAKALRTTRFGNGAEKVRKCTVRRLLSN